MLLGFALGGAWKGAIAQAFALAGVVVGLWAAGWIAQWVGLHWQGARPAVAFFALRWVVAGLGGFALAALFQWWGAVLGGAVREGPFGWLDRAGGLAVGAAQGTLVVTLVLLAMLLTAWPRELGEAAARARVSAPLMHGAAVACDVAGSLLPGGGWLESRFRSAHERARAGRT